MKTPISRRGVAAEPPLSRREATKKTLRIRRGPNIEQPWNRRGAIAKQPRFAGMSYSYLTFLDYCFEFENGDFLSICDAMLISIGFSEINDCSGISKSEI